MIVVVADDLSGAAELGGLAAKVGLSTEIHTDFDPDAVCDVICVTTDSRSLSEVEAAGRARKMIQAIQAIKPDWIYKKTDSVLRGNVRVEIEVILSAAGLDKAVLIPANPGKGRIVRSGRYFIHGTPLHKTIFAVDPDHPCRTNLVRTLLGDSPTILTPDTPDSNSIRKHAESLDHHSTMPAGGAEFFDALLPHDRCAPASYSLAGDSGLLLICGSASAWQLGRASQCQTVHIPVATYPFTAFPKYANRLCLAIGKPETTASPAQLLDSLVQEAVRLINRFTFDRILLEGGATAAAVMEKMGWSRFRVLPTFGEGIAQLKVLNFGRTTPSILVKPGSYDWPREALIQGRS